MEVETWELEKALQPVGALSDWGWCPRPWFFSCLPAFLASYFPASLPCSFIQHRTELCWALAHHRHTVSKCPQNGDYVFAE